MKQITYKLQRLRSNQNETLGQISLDDKFKAFTLEDEHRDQKVKHETRIPAGTYEIKLRKLGGMTLKYQKLFPKMHKGMLWLQNVPGFEFIYIHIGNLDTHSSGCILVGRNHTVTNNKMTLVESKVAYEALYKEILLQLELGNQVFIEIINEIK